MPSLPWSTLVSLQYVQVTIKSFSLHPSLFAPCRHISVVNMFNYELIPSHPSLWTSKTKAKPNLCRAMMRHLPRARLLHFHVVPHWKFARSLAIKARVRLKWFAETNLEFRGWLKYNAWSDLGQNQLSSPISQLYVLLRYHHVLKYTLNLLLSWR